MSNLKILVWQNKEGTGEADVEVTIPMSMVKWVPKLMRFIPKKTKEETWGDGVDFDQMFTGLDEVVKEASQNGHPDLMQVKSKDAFVKIFLEN